MAVRFGFDRAEIVHEVEAAEHGTEAVAPDASSFAVCRAVPRADVAVAVSIPLLRPDVTPKPKNSSFPHVGDDGCVCPAGRSLFDSPPPIKSNSDADDWSWTGENTAVDIVGDAGGNNTCTCGEDV